MLSTEEVDTMIDMMIRDGWKSDGHDGKGDLVFYRMLLHRPVYCTVETRR